MTTIDRAAVAPLRVLIVDDSSLVRMYYRAALEKAGFEVEQARGPLQGMKGAQQPVHLGVARAVALDCDQRVGRLRDQVARFGDELFAERAHRDAPVNTAT